MAQNLCNHVDVKLGFTTSTLIFFYQEVNVVIENTYKQGCIPDQVQIDGLGDLLSNLISAYLYERLSVHLL